MDWLEKKKFAETWFQEGTARGATHLLILYDVLLCEYRPVFIFPEQSVESEVMRMIFHNEKKEDMLIAVIPLSEDMERQLLMAFKPIHMAVSRVEN